MYMYIYIYMFTNIHIFLHQIYVHLDAIRRSGGRSVRMGVAARSSAFKSQNACVLESCVCIFGFAGS